MPDGRNDRPTPATADVALRQSEDRYRRIVESARDYAIFTTDPDLRIDSWSPGAAAVFGWTSAAIIGQPVDVTFTEEDRAAGAHLAEFEQARRTGIAPDVRWHLRRDGSRVFIEGTTSALRDDDGALRGFLKVGQDVTGRREVEARLRASENRYRTLVENIYDYAIFLLDAEGRVSEWTPGAERVKGYAAEEIVGQHLRVFFTESDRRAGEPEREIRDATEHGRAEREGWRVRKDGSHVWVNEIITAVRSSDGTLTGFTKISRDLTDRRLTEEASERARVESDRLALRRMLADAEEDERRRLARELHDQLGQQLTAFSLGLEDAIRHASRRVGTWQAAEHAPEQEALLNRLSGLQSLAYMMTMNVRYLALELRPPELDDVGLVSAVQTYVSEWSSRYGIESEVTIAGVDEETVPTEVGSTVYRIVQEALTNIAKHARATHASVIVERTDGVIRLIIEDDGVGFDVDTTLARARAERRLGLAGIGERVELVGGELSIESTVGRGTTLFIRLPV